AGERLDGDIKGTVGLGLLGFELGFVLTPAVGLHDATWAWYTLPAVGAVGGVVAGYFAFERGSVDKTVSISLLSGGMILLVPAVVSGLWIKNRRELADVPTVAA